MNLRLKRLCALLLATVYLGFAGGIEFLHHHADGVFPGLEGMRFAVGKRSAPPGIGKAPFAKGDSNTSECAACQLAKNGHATPLSVIPPVVVAPTVESAFVQFSSLFTPAPLDTFSSRGPPLA